jgi:hypothetical protein
MMPRIRSHHLRDDELRIASQLNGFQLRQQLVKKPIFTMQASAAQAKVQGSRGRSSARSLILVGIRSRQ